MHTILRNYELGNIFCKKKYLDLFFFKNLRLYPVSPCSVLLFHYLVIKSDLRYLGEANCLRNLCGCKRRPNNSIQCFIMVFIHGKWDRQLESEQSVKGEQNLKMETYSRRNNLKFEGVVETTGENTEQVIWALMSQKYKS